MKCEICNQGPPLGPTIHRVNKPGEMPARWRCDGCLTAEQKAAIDPEVKDIVSAIETDRRPTIEELERMLASGEPLKIQLQPDGSIRAVRPVTAAIAECAGMADMIDALASHATEDDHKSGEYGNWRHDSEILRMAARILKRYSEPPSPKPPLDEGCAEALQLQIPCAKASEDACAGHVSWDHTPPPGVCYQTHKFSFLDAVEIASNMLRTDYAIQPERLVVGRDARCVIITLPMFISAEPVREGTYTRLGVVGRRAVLLDDRPCFDSEALLVGSSKEVKITLIGCPHAV